MQQQITGVYYYPKSSKAVQAELHVTEGELSLHYLQQCTFVTHVSQVTATSNIPGLSSEVVFADGGKFIATDSSVRLSFAQSKLEKLEKNKLLIVASTVLVPFLLWFCLMILLPKIADGSVQYLPESISEQMGEQAFYTMEAVLSPSELEQEIQLTTKSQWEKTLAQLDLSSDKYVLHIYKSDYLGANAFALSDGTVVITDDLLVRLDDKPDAILAILLHEIGHVEHQHSLRMVAQSASSALVFAIIFGDMEGIGEVLLGTGSTLLQNAFSRKMEREADDYALNRLLDLGKQTKAFADAMQSFLDSESPQEANATLQYLSTHPAVEERIQHAKEFGK